MIRREEMLNEERDRIEAYEALARPAGADAVRSEAEDGPPPPIEVHDAKVYEDAPQEDDLVGGLDRIGLDPRLESDRS
jgi:hypothetical protein